MKAEDIDIVAFGGGHFLALLHFANGGGEVAEVGSFFEARVFGGRLHAAIEFVG